MYTVTPNMAAQIYLNNKGKQMEQTIDMNTDNKTEVSVETVQFAPVPVEVADEVEAQADVFIQHLDDVN